MSAVLQLVDVTRVHGQGAAEVHALRGISFTAYAGELVAVMGPSGSGKSTLLTLAGGLDTPTAGTVSIEGRDLGGLGRAERARLRRSSIGYVFQDARLFPHLSVTDNLNYGRRMNRLADDPVQRKRVVELLDIGHLLGRRPGQLSGGERQRVAFGRALLSKPRLLLLDEPLGALDEGRKLEILPYLVRLRDEAGIPMVYVSHDAAELRQLATQIVMLRSGHVAAFGGVKVLTSAPSPDAVSPPD